MIKWALNDRLTLMLMTKTQSLGMGSHQRQYSKRLDWSRFILHYYGGGGQRQVEELKTLPAWDEEKPTYSQALTIFLLPTSPGDHRGTHLPARGLPGQDEEGGGVHSEPRL